MEQLDKDRRMINSREEAYFLGTTENEENVYLVMPSFDCGWYWGLGYIEIYEKGRHQTHTHFKGYIIGGEGDKYTYHLNEVVKDSVLTEKESWVLSELMRTAYLYKEMLELYNRGGTNFSKNPLKEYLQSEVKYKEVCEVILPKIFSEIDKLLKGKDNELITEEYFSNQVKYTN